LILTAGVAAVVLALPVLLPDQYWLRLATLIGIYALLGLGLNVVAGFAGLLDLGNVAFYALGAYAYALLASPQLGLHLSFPVVLLIALALAAALSTVLGFSALRLYGDYLAIATLGFGQIVRLLLINLDRPVNLTNGPNGIVRLDPFRLIPGLHPGPQVRDLTGFYYVMLVLLALAGLLVLRLTKSYLGRAWVALRDDELAAAASGVDLPRFKLGAYVLGACLAAVAGVLFAGWQAAVFPENFTLNEVINIYCLVILGGIGNLPGILVGATAIVVLPELLREWAVYRMLIWGFVLVALVRFRPQGIFPARTGLGGGEGEAVEEDGGEAADGTAGEDVEVAATALTGAPVLQVRDLSVTFGGLKAVEGLSLEVRAGEIVGLIGPNGAGKTTVYNAISGFVRPAVGHILVNGQEVTGGRPQDIAGRGLARTFQAIRLFPGLSVLENAAIGAHRRAAASLPAILFDRGKTRAIEARAFGAARRALAAVAPELAGGQAVSGEVSRLTYADRRRLEIARALAADPSLLLLDEPAAGMSPVEADDLIHRLRALRTAGRAILLVEHRMSMVMELCDRLVVIDHGRKLAEGPPDEVRSDPAVIAAYLGTEQPGGVQSGRLEGRPAAGHPAHLRLEGLTAGYRGLTVLRHFDLEARPGEIVCLLGANGAGKSTVIRSILGATDRSAGRVLLDGGEITRLRPAQIIGHGVAVVPEGRHIFGRMTVEENLQVMLDGVRAKPGDRFDYVYGLFPRLLERRHQLAGTLSGGEQQMLAIGRALMARPRLICLDEPTMGLAPLMARATLEAVERINAEGVTIILAEQNAAALSIADRVYIVETGRVAAEGGAGEFLNRQDVVERYLGGRAPAD
jgi:ABC-type branched-subunit amino acid transport system ATPase component/ABC-type branched-subunit amino acid transport system permease subunit